MPSTNNSLIPDGQRSFVEDYAVPNKARVPASVGLEEQFKDLGVQTDQVAQEVEVDQAMSLRDRYLALDAEAESVMSKAADGAVMGAAQVALGTGIAFRDVAKNTYNALVGVADAAENYAASIGVGSGDLLSEANKWDDVYGAQAAGSLDATGDVTRSVVSFAGPLLATMGTGGSFALGMGVNAAYNYLAVDPKQARVSDHLRGTFLSEVPVAADMIDFLSNKPDDTEQMGRLKNLLEGAGIDLGVGALLWSASKAYSGITKMRAPKAIADAEAEVATAKAPKAPAEQPGVVPEGKVPAQADEVLPDGTVKPAATPEPTKPVVEVDTPEQLATFDKDWDVMGTDKPGVSLGEDGKVLLNLSSDDMLRKFYEIAEQVDAKVLREPMSDADLIAAADVLKNDPTTIERLASWDVSKGLPTDKETIVLKYVMQQGDASLRSTVEMVSADPDNPMKLVKLVREMENYTRLNNIRTGTGSAKAAALRAEQVVAAMAATGQKEAMAMIGATGRAKLYSDVIESYGGKESLKQMAQNAEYLSKIKVISEIPDADFAYKMGNVVQKTGWMKLEDAITKVALNGMLSSPMTSGKALLTNMVTTGKTVIDNYIAVGVGGMTSNEGAKTMAEANAHFMGVISGFFEGVQPAWQVLRKGEIQKGVRMDLVSGIQKVAHQDELMEKASGAWASTIGSKVMGVADDAVGMPTRVLMSVDTYWNRVNYNGAINARAVREAKRAQDAALKSGATFGKKEFDDFVTNYVAKPPASADHFAEKLAQTNTMAKQLDGFAEAIDNAIGKSGQIIPFPRVVVPFFKTNANLIEYTVQNSPLAPMFSTEFKAALKAGGATRDEAIAKVVSGSMMVGGFAALANTGMITGRGTDNPSVQRALKDNATVALPTSIKVGDAWLSLAGIEPLATFLNMGDMASKIAGYVGEEEYAEMASAMAIMASEIVSPEQLTDTFSGLLNAISASSDKEREEAIQYLQTIPTRFVPFAGAMTDIRQTMDPVVRNTRGVDFLDSVQNRFSNMVPWLSKDLPVSRNIWGETLMLPDGIGPDAMSPIATTGDEGMRLKRALESMDDFYETTKDVNMGMTKFNLQMPDRFIKNPFAGASYELTPHEYDAYIQLAAGVNPDTGQPLRKDGMTLKDIASGIITKYDGYDKRPQDMNPRVYMRMVGELSEAFKFHRGMADKLILRHGDIGRKIKDQAAKYRSLGGFEE